MTTKADEMPDVCRAEFERWCKERNAVWGQDFLPKHNAYLNPYTNAEWGAWRAAYTRQQEQADGGHDLSRTPTMGAEMDEMYSQTILQPAPVAAPETDAGKALLESWILFDGKNIYSSPVLKKIYLYTEQPPEQQLKTLSQQTDKNITCRKVYIYGDKK